MKKYHIFLFLAFCTFMVTCKNESPEIKTPLKPISDRINEILPIVGATKTMDTFDELNCHAYSIIQGNNSPEALMQRTLETDDIKEGLGSFRISYNFGGKSLSATPEYISLVQRWGDFRSDLSFEPLGISIWVKGKSSNNAALRVILMQDESMTYQEKNTSLYEYTDNEILSKEGWNRLIIPYEYFNLFRLASVGDSLNLKRVIGFRLDVVNTSNSATSGDFLIDNLEQLTSYKPIYSKPKFNSIFVQLGPEYNLTNWDENFRQTKEIGVDTWIIQYSHGYGNLNYISFYSNSNAPWNRFDYSIIDKMVAAAERQNTKLIFGLSGFDYDNMKLSDPAMYSSLLEKDKFVADELYTKFGQSSCFAGWYITEEFHDGTYPAGWLQEPATSLLGGFLQNVASYVKSKNTNLSVSIAPALWRGVPADLSANFFKAVLSKTPDIDYMYLQDIGGRCLVDVDVDLPNYYAKIKKVCDEIGIEFGIDVESFLDCYCPRVPYRAQSWDELKEQLFMAGLYTTNITNFSWATFKPGLDSFEGYKTYYNSTK